MSCHYCDRILASSPRYMASEAAFDLGSESPRCKRHWHYVCASCSKPSHFMSSSFCSDYGRFYCSACAPEKREVDGTFWAWKYHFEHRCPWCGDWHASLDRLEHDGLHPLENPATAPVASAAVSTEPFLARYPVQRPAWRSDQAFSDDDVRANWNRNADRWTATYDEDGDPNRRYQSDEPMLAMLGAVSGLRVLDVGSGNGYLCRKLARAGALMTGVELSDSFLRQATALETREPLGIRYHQASAADMSFLLDSCFDKAVSNYVLMDVREYEAAVREVFRVLNPGGTFVAVISHPAFASGHGWFKSAPDSPRAEERTAWLSDLYFQRGPYLGVWGNFDPVLSFHRPLRDYWRTFKSAGFRVDDFEEPSISDRGRRELPPWRIERVLRIPYSCLFKLVKPE